MISELFTVYLTRYTLLHTYNSITTEFFGTLQGFTWFIYLFVKRVPFLDIKYLSGDSM